jgi:hypothetical protein
VRSLRTGSILWAIAGMAGLYALVTVGWWAGFGTSAAMGFGAVWLVAQIVLAVVAAVGVYRRPFLGAVAFAGAVLTALPLLAWMTWLPHQSGLAGGLVVVAAALVGVGIVAQRLPAPPARRRAGWRVALDERPAAGIRQDSGRE